MKKLYIVMLSVIVFAGCSTQKTDATAKAVSEKVATNTFDRSQMPKPGPAPKVNVQKPKEFKLDNGLTVLVVENHKLPRVSLNLGFDNPLKAYGDKKGVNGLLSSVMGKGTADMTKDEFNEEIEFMGAFVSISSGGVSASTLSRFFPRVLELTAKGALQPRFEKEEFDIEKEKYILGLKADEKNVSTVAGNMNDFLTYGSNHPHGEFTTAKTINNVKFEDVLKEYKETFSPENAYLVIVGDVKFDEVKTMVEKEFSSWKKFPVKKIDYKDPVDLPQAEINFINMPNAVQTELTIKNLVNLKVSDPDYFAAIMANQILGGGGEGRLFLNLREAHGWTYGSYSGIGANKYITSFTAKASVRNAVTDSAIVEMRKEIDRIRKEYVTKEELDMAKAKYIGNFVMKVQEPETIASFALKTKTQNLPSDFYENFIQGIESVTIEDVQRVANKYFKYGNSRIVVVGKAADVLPALQKMNYPIRYFDKDGNETGDPLKEMGNVGDMTAKKVIDAYVKAIGGEKKVANVKTTKISFEINGLAPTPIQGEIVSMAPNKEKTVMMMNGSVIMSNVFDGETEKVSGMMGNKENSGEEVASQKAKKGIFPQAFYSAEEMTLKGIEKVNDKDAYKLEVVIAGKTKTEYYDKETGLLVSSVQVTDSPQGPIEISIGYDDYKEVKGIKFPFIMNQKIGPQEMKLEVKNIEVNENVSEQDFQ